MCLRGVPVAMETWSARMRINKAAHAHTHVYMHACMHDACLEPRLHLRTCARSCSCRHGCNPRPHRKATGRAGKGNILRRVLQPLRPAQAATVQPLLLRVLRGEDGHSRAGKAVRVSRVPAVHYSTGGRRGGAGRCFLHREDERLVR